MPTPPRVRSQPDATWERVWGSTANVWKAQDDGRERKRVGGRGTLAQPHCFQSLDLVP